MSILLLETLDPAGTEILEQHDTVILSPSPRAHDRDLPFQEISAIVTRGLGQLDQALMEKCPNLKVIARCGAGLNNLDLATAKRLELQVIYAPGINAAAVAEHTLMLMLGAVRQGFQCIQQVKDGNWNFRNKFSGDNLAGKHVCIVGGGNIGQATANLCTAIGMKVSVCSRNGNGMAGLYGAMEEALPSADIVSLHLPLTSDTHHMFDETLLSNFSSGTVLINTARGELVDETALLNALNSGQVLAYASDVMDGEPPQASNSLIAHERCHVTPHIAALTASTYQEMSIFTARNVVAALQSNSADPASIYQGAA